MFHYKPLKTVLQHKGSVIMGLKFQQTDSARSRASVILDSPENSFKKRIMMRVRAFQNLVSLLLVLSSICFIVYGSSLYLGAFVDVGEFVASSQSVRAQKTKDTIVQMPHAQKKTIISSFTQYFATDRFYLRRGQSVLATYSLPKNSNIHLQIKQCKMIPIIETFRCTIISDQDKTVFNQSTGFVEFIASRPGFYHFEEKVMGKQDVPLSNSDYRVVWQRGGKKAL